MTTSVVRWYDRSPIPPPRQAPLFIKLLRPRAGCSFYGVGINQDLISVDTHWLPELKGKVRCRQMWGEECPWCPDPDRHWYGYLPVLFFATGKVACLEVSYGAAMSCPQMSTKRVPLRGMRVEVGRYQSGPQGRCWAKVEAYVRPIVLPPAEDAPALLDLIFGPTESGIPSRKLGRKGGGA